MKSNDILRRVGFIAGHTRLTIRGEYPERFLNACIGENIPFRKVRKKDGELCLNIPVGSLETAEQLALRLMLDVAHRKTSGSILLLKFARKRLLLVIGLFAAVIVLMLSQSVILKINIVGNSQISDERILWVLRQEGVGIGTRARSIHSEWLKPRVILKIPELSWFYINVKGNVATVNVREHTPAPDIVDEDLVMDVRAERSGLIEKIEVHSGSAAVKIGDVVAEGEVLISSKIESQYIAERYVRAAGVVSGRTWYSICVKIPLYVDVKEYTAREKTVFNVIFSGKRINLSILSGIPYGFYDKITSYENFTLPGGYCLPFALEKETYMEFIPRRITLSEDEVYNATLDSIHSVVENYIGDGSIEDVRASSYKENDVLTIKIYVQCSEKLAQ